MTAAEQHLLIDASNLAVLLLGVSFMFRRLTASLGDPVPTAGKHGKVETHWFELPELALALTFVALLYATVRFPAIREIKGHPVEFLVQNGLVLMTFTILVVASLVRKHDIVRLFGFDRVQGRALAIWIVISFTVITLCTFAAMWLWQAWIRDLLGPAKPQDSILRLRENPNLLVSYLFSAVVMAPFVEEILFRGFLYPTLKRYTQPLVAMVVTAGIFAAIHLHLPSLFPLFVLSCLLTVAYELCGSLWVPILVHATFNALNITITMCGIFLGHAG